MTISTTVAETRYNGTGNQTLFPTSFKFLQNSHVTVIHSDAGGAEQTWVEGTHFTLTGAGDENGGTVNVSTSPTDYTPAVGEKLVITRVIPQTQETDYPEGGAFPASAHEAALDLLTMMIQKHSAEILRSLLFPISDPATAIASLPNSTSRASKYLAFDAGGKPIASSGPAGQSEVPVSSFMETVLDDSTATDARTTLGAAGLGDANAFTGANTHAGTETFNAQTRWAKGSDITSASPLVLGTDGNYFDVTGTTGFSSITVAAGTLFMLQFDGALTLTHGVALDLPGEADIATVAGDRLIGFAEAANTVQVLSYSRADGTALAADGITLATEQDSSSGTAIDFTGIPAGTKRITIMFEGVSLSGTDKILVQLGDSGGIETSGYVAESNHQQDVTANAVASSTSGFVVNVSGASFALTGIMTLCLKDSTNFTWGCNHNGRLSTTIVVEGAGVKSLSAELTQVRITPSGTNTFDAGSINIQYE